MDFRSEADGFSRCRQAVADGGRIGLGRREGGKRHCRFCVVDMFASYCTGREDAKGAIKIAERQLQRIYR
jgi:multiple sugar transport system substrate-binding protein